LFLFTLHGLDRKNNYMTLLAFCKGKMVEKWPLNPPPMLKATLCKYSRTPWCNSPTHPPCAIHRIATTGGL
jgi:hypothetical protein